MAYSGEKVIYITSLAPILLVPASPSNDAPSASTRRACALPASASSRVSAVVSNYRLRMSHVVSKNRPTVDLPLMSIESVRYHRTSECAWLDVQSKLTYAFRLLTLNTVCNGDGMPIASQQQLNLTLSSNSVTTMGTGAAATTISLNSKRDLMNPADVLMNLWQAIQAATPRNLTDLFAFAHYAALRRASLAEEVLTEQRKPTPFHRSRSGELCAPLAAAVQSTNSHLTEPSFRPIRRSTSAVLCSSTPREVAHMSTSTKTVITTTRTSGIIESVQRCHSARSSQPNKDHNHSEDQESQKQHREELVEKNVNELQGTSESLRDARADGDSPSYASHGSETATRGRASIRDSGGQYDTAWAAHSLHDEFRRMTRLVETQISTTSGSMNARSAVTNNVGPGVDVSSWYHIISLQRSELFSTYPTSIIVPKRVTVSLAERVAQYRHNGRIPSVSWIHLETGAALARAAQPGSGSYLSSDADALFCSFLSPPVKRTQHGQEQVLGSESTLSPSRGGTELPEGVSRDPEEQEQEALAMCRRLGQPIRNPNAFLVDGGDYEKGALDDNEDDYDVHVDGNNYSNNSNSNNRHRRHRHEMVDEDYNNEEYELDGSREAEVWRLHSSLSVREDGSGYDVVVSTSKGSDTAETKANLLNGACHTTQAFIQGAEAEPRLLHFMDCRSRATAAANFATGGGYEIVRNYPSSDIQFLNLDNIHAVRSAFSKLGKLCLAAQRHESKSATRAHPSIPFLTKLDNTGWPEMTVKLLRAAWIATENLTNGESVVVHCTDGWDRTTQVVSLAMLQLDGYYRTVEGFCVLVMREWLEMGHRFADRCAHDRSGDDAITLDAAGDDDNPIAGASSSSSVIQNNHNMSNYAGINLNNIIVNSNNFNSGSSSYVNASRGSASHQVSPIFVQFIDAVYQLLRQFPTAFEFTPRFLQYLVDELYSCRFGTFLYNCHRSRYRQGGPTRHTASLWGELDELVQLERGGSALPHTPIPAQERLINPFYILLEATQVESRRSKYLTHRLVPNFQSRRYVFWHSQYIRFTFTDGGLIGLEPDDLSPLIESFLLHTHANRLGETSPPQDGCLSQPPPRRRMFPSRALNDVLVVSTFPHTQRGETPRHCVRHASDASLHPNHRRPSASGGPNLSATAGKGGGLLERPLMRAERCYHVDAACAKHPIGGKHRLWSAVPLMESEADGSSTGSTDTTSPLRCRPLVGGDVMHHIVEHSEYAPRSMASACEVCAARFTFFFRRHACRHCCRAVCSKCGGRFLRLPSSLIRLYEERGTTQPVRVCSICYSKVVQHVNASQQRH